MLKNLINWEIEKGYKAKYVAKKIGVSEAKYCLIKNGKQKATMEFAYKFSDAFPEENIFELLKKEN